MSGSAQLQGDLNNKSATKVAAAIGTAFLTTYNVADAAYGSIEAPLGKYVGNGYAAFLYGGAGLINVLHAPLRTHAGADGLMTSKIGDADTVNAFVGEKFLNPAGWLDILFDLINFVKHIKKAIRKVEQDNHEEDLAFQIDVLAKKIKIVEGRQANSEDEKELRELRLENGKLMHDKALLERDLKVYSEARQKRQKRLRWFLASIWTLLLARSIMGNTAPLLLLMMTLAEGFSGSALGIAMAVKAICCGIELYYINQELKQNQEAQQRIEKDFLKVFEELDKNNIPPAIRAGSLVELDSLMLQHAMRKDEEKLLQASATKKKWDITLFGTLGTIAIVSVILAATGACPPLGLAILTAVSFMAIGLYVIPSIWRQSVIAKEENNSLTNVTEIRGSNRMKSGEIGVAKNLGFKSELHALHYISTLTTLRNEKGAAVPVTPEQKATMSQRVLSAVQKGKSNQQAFKDAGNECYKALAAVMAHIKKDGEKALSTKELADLNGIIRNLAKGLLKMKALQTLCPHEKFVIPDGVGDAKAVLTRMLAGVKKETFFAGGGREPNIEKVLAYCAKSRYEIEHGGQALLDAKERDSTKKVEKQLINDFHAVEKRSERANARFTVWTFFSQQARADRGGKVWISKTKNGYQLLEDADGLEAAENPSGGGSPESETDGAEFRA